MSGSDRFLSMALDDIIKMRRKNNGSARAGGAASTSRNSRGSGQTRGSQRGRGQRFAQRGGGQRIVGQGRGGGAQTNRQQFRSQRSFRGQRGGSLSSWQSRQSLTFQERGRQRRGGPRSWASQQSVASIRGRRQQNVALARRGRQQNAALVRQGRQLSAASIRGRRPQSLVSQRRQQNVLLARGNMIVRSNQTRNQLQIRARGPRLQPAQLARNRVRLATQILLRRKRQLQELQMVPQGQSQRGGRLLRSRRGGAVRTMRQGVSVVGNLRGIRGGASLVGSRRGAFLTKLATRAQVTYKMARVNRNRAAQVQSQMLSVNIHNERALATETLHIPPLLVINRPPNTEMVSHMAMSAIARRQNIIRQPRAHSALREAEVEVLPVPLPMPRTPGRKLTLHERFSQS